MKVTIKAEDDYFDGVSSFELENDSLDNMNYVTLSVANIKDDRVDYKASVDVSVEDLYRAAQLFNKARIEAKKDYV
jgi:hypothetical protein